MIWWISPYRVLYIYLVTWKTAQSTHLHSSDCHWKPTVMVIYSDVHRYSNFKLSVMFNTEVFHWPLSLSQLQQLHQSWMKFLEVSSLNCSIFLKTGRFYPPSISKPLTLSVSPQFLNPSSCFLFFSVSLSLPLFLSISLSLFYWWFGNHWRVYNQPKTLLVIILNHWKQKI